MPIAVTKILRLSCWHARNVSIVYGFTFFATYFYEKVCCFFDFLTKKNPEQLCNCCGSRITRFVSFIGFDYLPKSLRCPVCGSMPRHRYLCEFIKKEIFPTYSRPTVLRYSPEPFFDDLMDDYPNATYLRTDITQVGLISSGKSVLSDAQEIPIKSDAVECANKRACFGAFV